MRRFRRFLLKEYFDCCVKMWNIRPKECVSTITIEHKDLEGTTQAACHNVIIIPKSHLDSWQSFECDCEYDVERVLNSVN